MRTRPISLVALPSTVFIWWHAIRPRTLSMSIVPVLTGAVLAWAETGRFALVPVLAALIGAFGIQIGTNLLNDASDGESGLDGPARLGPPRVTAEGWVSAAQVKAAALLAFVTAAFAGLVLVFFGGLPILAIGMAALVAGWAYSRGPAPIAASPLGELFVLMFFGIVAVSGTYILLADRPSWTMLFAGILVGLPAAAVLLVNNHRDRFDDLRAGRRTLAIRLGLRATRRLYAVFIAATLAMASLIALVDARPELALPLAAAPTAWWLMQEMEHARIDSRLNLLLGRTAGFQAMVAGLFALGLLISA